MTIQSINSISTLFQNRLSTLEHLLQLAQAHFKDSELFLQKRIAADMFPFGTQITFTCNQPRNFALWCNDKPMDNLDSEVTSLVQAYEIIEDTRVLLSSVETKDEKLGEVTRIDLDQGIYIEIPGSTYVNDFLIPNFYFHMVTAYSILRMAGVPIGKRDYMMHLVPYIKQGKV
jgi:uncharacterized protein